MLATIASSNDGPAHYTTQGPGTTTPSLPSCSNSVKGRIRFADDQQSMPYRDMIQGLVSPAYRPAQHLFRPGHAVGLALSVPRRMHTLTAIASKEATGAGADDSGWVLPAGSGRLRLLGQQW